MPTNEERREVARKLRGEKCGFAGWVGAVYIALEVDGETAGCDMLDLLADLIEPEPERTCYNMSDFQDCDCFICSECGEAFETARLEYDDDLFYSLNDAVHEDYYDRCDCDLNYCPNCGAMVIEE